MNILAIDPGAAGSLCLFGDKGVAQVSKMPKGEDEVAHLVSVLSQQCDRAIIERVHAMPGGGDRKMGATSAFSFGRGYGFLRACLVNCNMFRGPLPWEDVAPQTWQAGLGLGKCSGPDRKRALRNLARQRFPNFAGITLVTADSMLLAEWGWLRWRADAEVTAP